MQLMGHLGNEPELKKLESGQYLLKLNLATNERFRTAEGEWQTDTQWHPVVVWGKQAERMAAMVHKGSGLLVEGRLVHRRYETKDGEKRTGTEVVLTEFFVLAAREAAVEATA